MKCYYHPDVEAVGICKSCNRGLCPNCAAEFDDGLACRNRCEEQVQTLNAMIDRNRVLIERTPSNYSRVSLLYGMMGVVMLVFGITTESAFAGAGMFLIIIGAIFMVGAFLYYRTYRKSRTIGTGAV